MSTLVEIQTRKVILRERYKEQDWTVVWDSGGGEVESIKTAAEALRRVRAEARRLTSRKARAIFKVAWEPVTQHGRRIIQNLVNDGWDHEYVDQEVMGRIDPFTWGDHGTDALVLVRTPLARLVWRRGGMHWASVGKERYGPTTLDLHFFDGDGNRGNFGLHTGGRLSRALIQQHIDKIRQHLQMPKLRSRAIYPKRTLVVSPIISGDERP